MGGDGDTFIFSGGMIFAARSRIHHSGVRYAHALVYCILSAYLMDASIL